MTEGPEQTPAFRSYDGLFRYAGPTGHEGLLFTSKSSSGGACCPSSCMLSVIST